MLSLKEKKEKEILSQNTITAKILKFFIEHENEIITADKLSDGLQINFNTAWGTIYRLNTMDIIKKESRGKYIYSKELDIHFPPPEALGIGEEIGQMIEEDIKEEKPPDEAIDADIEKNLQEFYNEKNKRIKYRALQNLKVVVGNYNLRRNANIWQLINKLPDRIENQYHWQVINLIERMIYFEKKKGEWEDTAPIIEDIIMKAKKTLIKTLLSEKADPNARKTALDILISHVDEDVIDTYIKIMWMDNTQWNYFAYGYYEIMTVIKDTKKFRKLFLEEVEKLYKEEDDQFFKRGEQMYRYIRMNYYKEFFLSD